MTHREEVTQGSRSQPRLAEAGPYKNLQKEKRHPTAWKFRGRWHCIEKGCTAIRDIGEAWPTARTTLDCVILDQTLQITKGPHTCSTR